MADREVVIKISEEMYKWVNDVNKFSNDYGTDDFIYLIKNGTPLPQGHGRLIDRNEFNNYVLCRDKGFQQLLESLPTILEADEGAEQ